MLKVGRGAHGKYENNTRRDLLNKFVYTATLQPLFANCPFRMHDVGKLGSQIAHMDLPILSPFCIFEELYKNFPILFDKWVTSGLRSFWDSVSEDDPKLKNHPMQKCKSWKNRAVPMVMWGDAAEFAKKHGTSILIMGWKILLDLGFEAPICFLLALTKQHFNKSTAFGDDTARVIYSWVSLLFTSFFKNRSTNRFIRKTMAK